MDTETPETATQAPAAEPAPSATKERHGKVFDLVADTRGAGINGALYALYSVAFLVIALRTEEDTAPFYVVYFMLFLAVFQGATIVFRHCLHLFPKSTVRLEVVGSKTLRVTRRNGEQLDLSRDIDYTRRKRTLILQGKTHDNQAYNEVIRQGALPDGNLDTLVNALKRFR